MERSGGEFAADHRNEVADALALEAQKKIIAYRKCKDPESAAALEVRAIASQAFGALIVEEEPRLKKWGMGYTQGNEDLVEEALQESYIRAWNGLPKFKGDSSINTWLTTILRNKIKDLRKKRSYTTLSLGAFLDADEGAERYEDLIAIAKEDEPESVVVRAEKYDAATQAIDELSSRALRETATLRFIGELSHPEIAQRLGIGEGASKVRLHRASKLLRNNERLQNVAA